MEHHKPQSQTRFALHSSLILSYSHKSESNDDQGSLLLHLLMGKLGHSNKLLGSHSSLESGKLILTDGLETLFVCEQQCLPLFRDTW